MSVIHSAGLKLNTEPLAVSCVTLEVSLAMAKAARTRLEPASNLPSASAGVLVSEQACAPAAAIGMLTALPRFPPALTCAVAKQSGAISGGS